ncbi:cytochrome c biogenesis protein [Spirochaetia bacterium]|nr:cytochrome c biogenesis protein [Spirochaetia bacterium]
MKSRYTSDKLAPYLFITPFMLSFLIFFLLPAAYSLVLSFFQYKGYGAMRFVGFNNYASLLTYNTFWLSVRNTFFYFILHTIPTMILSFVLAYMLQSKLMHGIQRVFKPVLFLPQVVPIIASALIWRILLARDFGAVNQLLGTSIDFLQNAAIRKWSVVLMLIWRSTGWYMVIFLAGLTTIGEEIYDASKIDGANTLQRIFRITLPMMRPIFLFAFIMNGIGSIKIFSEPNVLLSTNTGAITQPNAMAIMNVLLMNLRGANFGMASAVGWFVFLLVLVITAIWFRLLGGREE